MLYRELDEVRCAFERQTTELDGLRAKARVHDKEKAFLIAQYRKLVNR